MDNQGHVSLHMCRADQGSDGVLNFTDKPSVSVLLLTFFLASINKPFANSLDPDQDRLSVGTDLGPICLTVFLKEFFEKVNFE